MKNSTLVSVIITAYNREKYIEESIQSVLNQTLESWELIVVDDYSKDRTVEIARSFLNDKRIRVYVNNENIGDYPNRNYGASLAKGKYIKFLDADDIMYPHCLATMVNEMERFSDVAICFTKELGVGLQYPLILSPAESCMLHFLGPGLLSDAPTFAIYKSHEFRLAGGFAVDRVTSDFGFNVKIALKKKIMFVYPGLVFYRVHDESESAWGSKNSAVVIRYFRIQKNALEESLSLIEYSAWQRAKKNVIGVYLRCLLYELLRGNVFYSIDLLFGSRLTISELRYFIFKSRFSSINNLLYKK
jgi:glycosyltransferase involved in cell wall biosynthesis